MKLIKTLFIATGLLAIATTYAAVPMGNGNYTNNSYYNNYLQNYPYADGTKGPAPYVGGMFGLTTYTGTVYDNDGDETASSSQNGALGYGGFVGVMLFQYFGVEAGYMRYGDFNGKNSKGKEVRDYYTAPMLNVKGVLPFGNGFNIFGKLGFSNLTTHSSEKKKDNKNYSGLNLGIGAGYYFTPNVEATVEYFGTTVDTRANTSLTSSVFGFGIYAHI